MHAFCWYHPSNVAWYWRFMQHARHNILIRKVACWNDRQKGFVTCVSLPLVAPVSVFTQMFCIIAVTSNTAGNQTWQMIFNLQGNYSVRKLKVNCEFMCAKVTCFTSALNNMHVTGRLVELGPTRGLNFESRWSFTIPCFVFFGVGIQTRNVRRALHVVDNGLVRQQTLVAR